MSPSRIAELSAIIANHTSKIDSSLAANGLPTPSFDADSPPTLLAMPALAESRNAILQASDELSALMQGPIGLLTSPPVRIGSKKCVNHAG